MQMLTGKQRVIKGALLTIGILFGGILLGFGALCLAHLLPVEQMYRNIQGSKDVINSHAQLIPGYESTTIDNYTDSIMLNEAVCPTDDFSLIEKVIYNYQVNYHKQYDQQDNLLHYLQGEEDYKFFGYPHYWGGHQIILKPLLLRFDYADILIINMMLQTLLIAGVLMGLVRTGKRHLILPFLVAILSIMPNAIASCLQYSDVYYITMLGSLLIIWKYDKIKPARMYLLFLILGMATSYFDFLTYPFVSLGIPLVFFLAYSSKELLKKQIFYATWCSALWCVGYLGMWSGKWILSSLLMPDRDLIERALISIRYRSSDYAGGMTVDVFQVLLENLFVYLRLPTLFLIGISGIYLLVKVIKAKNIHKETLLKCISYLMVCCYPIAWYMISKNHSFEHAFMTYRELAISTFAGLCFLAELIPPKKEQSDENP